MIKNLGFGIKTFTATGSSKSEKVAEFDSKGQELRNLRYEPKILAKTIADYRNERIDMAKRAYGVTNAIYHLVVRRDSQILIFEQPMDHICISKIKILSNDKTLKFTDYIHDYSFNYSKSTLFQTFELAHFKQSIKVEIIDNPLELLRASINKGESIEFSVPKHDKPFIILALYSGQGDNKVVEEKSGLNQWNAAGRSRDSREVYIPIRSEIHVKYPDFFPERGVAFKLILPNGNILSAKVCQQGSKALMSNPNKDLGKWLLDEVLHQPNNQLVTYDQLERVGIDSVIITKLDHLIYSIDFKKVGSYENFIESQSTTETE